MKRLQTFEQFTVNEVSYGVLKFAKKDILWDMTLEEIAVNAFDIAKNKMSRMASAAQANMSSVRISAKHIFYFALEELAIEVTESTWKKLLKIYKRMFDRDIFTKNLHKKEPTVKLWPI